MTIGVAAVIILVAVGNGSKLAVQERINALGSNVLLVQPQGGRFGPGGAAAGITFTTKDADALADRFNAPDVARVSPVVNAAGTTLTSGGTSYQPSTFTGTVPAYATTRAYDLAERRDVHDPGRRATTGASSCSARPSCRTSSPAPTPSARACASNGTPFQVVGVTESKGSNGVADQDDVALAPLTAVQDTLTGYASGLSSITVEAASAQALDAAQAEVTAILTAAQGRPDPTNPGFQVINQGAVREASDASTDVFTTLLGAVAAISLLVGGIGVMNIMLVSVTERTREIGIRKAIGARRADILAQFLTEAVLVSALGGVTGVVVGIAGSQFRIAGVEPAIALYSVFLAFGASVLAGLFFGTYPAGRAARMRPIDALRFE